MKRRKITFFEWSAIMVVVIVSGLFTLSFFVSKGFDDAARASCANNLKQIGLALKMFAWESRAEVYPRVGFYYERLVDCDTAEYREVGQKEAVYTNSMYMPDIYPEYLVDANLLVCPTTSSDNWDWSVNSITGESDAARVCLQEGRGVTQAGNSYTYLNYFFDMNDADSPEPNYYMGKHKVNFRFWQVGPTAEISDIGRLGDFSDYFEGANPKQIQVQFGLYSHIIYDLKNSDPEHLFEVLDRSIELEKEYLPHVLSDIAPAGNIGSGGNKYNSLFRIKDGLGRFYSTTIGMPGNVPERYPLPAPVLFDNVGYSKEGWNHYRTVGSNVLYLDGHVEFVKFEENGTFPFNRTFADMMGAMRSHPTFMKK